MKRMFLVAAAAVLILAPCALTAQAPAGATGKCKDGTYTTAPTKKGACRGHKGVDTWLAASTPAAPAAASKPAAPAPAPAAAPAPAPAPAAAPTMAPKPAASKGSKAPKTVAPGGGPGLVWVNTNTKVYHCYGGDDYGTTKAGKYESEAQAKADGARPARGKTCGQ